jgi:type IV pilus assembly protein PilW
MKQPNTISKSAGFSLVELLVSAVLGLLLIAGAAAAYLSSKSSYTEVEQYSTLSENARFAELILSDALLHAGFFGEVTSERLVTNPNLIDIAGVDCAGEAAAYDFDHFLFGATVANNNTALDCITDAMAGTDVLVIKRAVPRPLSDGARVDGVRDGDIDTPGPLVAGTTYIMTNDVLGLPFDGSGPQPNILDGGEVPGGEAWPYLFEAYYVRDDPNDDDDIPMLARKVLSWNGAAMDVVTEELVEGVEDLRLRLGVDNNSDSEIDTYIDVADIAANDWDQVAVVEVYLLVRSTTKDPAYTDEKSYTLGGDNEVTPTDDPQRYPPEYHRLLVNTQASLRNPQLVQRR